MQTVEILERLVGFDTTSVRSNLELISWVEAFLTDRGVSSERLPSADGTKASLVARLGPDAPGGVVLCGHTDVVPTTGQPWTVSPYVLTEHAGRVYGRGTTDMKGFLASSLAAVDGMTAAHLRRPVILAFTHDEEIGCLGAAAMGEHLRRTVPSPAAVITGEPTQMQVVRSHKGVRVLRTTVTGRESHSSRTDMGASAIVAMARLVNHLDQLGQRLASTGPQSSDFQPPFSTINVGVIHGGQALNIVARECEITWEYRLLPGVDADEIYADVARFVDKTLLPQLRDVAPEATIVTETIADIPALEPAGNDAAATTVAAIGSLDQSPAVAYGTDGSLIARAGLPAIVCGPGSMEQGHQPDEFVQLDELARCDDFLRDLTAWCAAEA